MCWYGHIGDGNLHLNILKPPDWSERAFLERCHAVSPELFKLVAERSGSISAEHGVGLLKRDFLGYSRSPEEMALRRGLKRVFDPNGVMNPGKPDTLTHYPPPQVAVQPPRIGAEGALPLRHHRAAIAPAHLGRAPGAATPRKLESRPIRQPSPRRPPRGTAARRRAARTRNGLPGAIGGNSPAGWHPPAVRLLPRRATGARSWNPADRSAAHPTVLPTSARWSGRPLQGCPALPCRRGRQPAVDGPGRCRGRVAATRSRSAGWPSSPAPAKGGRPPPRHPGAAHDQHAVVGGKVRNPIARSR